MDVLSFCFDRQLFFDVYFSHSHQLNTHDGIASRFIPRRHPAPDVRMSQASFESTPPMSQETFDLLWQSLGDVHDSG